jgi:hypothetical protein
MIEIMRFRLAPESDAASETAFLEADQTLQEEFAYRQPGLVRRTTARAEDGTWVVIDLWRSAEDADACARRWDDDPVAQRFMAFVDRSTLSTERFMQLS